MNKLTEWVEKNKDNPDCSDQVRDYNLNKDWYDRKFVKRQLNDEVVECTHCGYPQILGDSANDEAMEQHKVCFHCWFWLHHIGLKDGPTRRSIIVNGKHYIDGGNKPKEGNKSFLGFGGAEWIYRKVGETEWTETNNMWHQGTIPKRLNIADTHEFKPYERKEV